MPYRAGTLVVLLASLHGTAFAQEEERRLTRVVEVLFADGEKPAAGVVVEAWGAPGGTVRRETGADGTVRFEKMPATGVVYVARKAGYRCGWHQPGAWSWAPDPEDDDPDGDGITRFTLLLATGSTLRGRVVAKEDGRPIAGAAVEARETAHATDRDMLAGAPLWTATTDADGHFETSEHWPATAEADDTVGALILARAEGRISAAVEVCPSDAGPRAPLGFELGKAATIRGIVTWSGGERAARVVVYASPDDSEGDGESLRALADAEGNYSFLEAEPGVAYRVYAEAMYGGRRTAVLGRSRVATVVAPVEAGCDLCVLRVGTLSVRVAQKACSPHFEFLPPQGTRPGVLDRVAEDGGVVVAEADAGRWTVVVRASEWLDKRVEVSLEEGEDRRLQVQLERGCTVAGQLLDDAGRPICDATVYAYPDDNVDEERWQDGYEEATTDAKGRFRLRGIPVGFTNVGVRHEDLLADAPTRVDAPAGDIRIVLYRPGGVRFRIRTPSGAPTAEHVRVTLTRLAGPSHGAQWQEVVESSEGRFEVVGQFPGRVELAVEARGFAPHLVQLELRPGEILEPEPFALSRGIALRGVVVDGSGKPVAKASVMAWGNEETAVATDASGGFELPHLALGRVEISVSADGMAQALLETSVAPDAQPMRIVITPGGLVRGRIPADDGCADWGSIDFFPADAADDNVSRWRAEVTDGSFAIRLPPGRYRCGRTTFEVREGAEVTIACDGR